MKKKLISHVVNAVTRHKLLVIIIFSILCVLSLVAISTSIVIDMSFKGMAGSGIDVVDDYDEIIRKFNVSGMGIVTVEPEQEIIDRVNNIKVEINTLVFDNINDDDKKEIVSLFDEYYEKSFSRNLSDKEIVKSIIKMLSIIPADKRSELLKSAENLDEKDIRFIEKFIHSKNADTQRDLYRKITKLSDDKLIEWIKYSKTLETSYTDELVKYIFQFVPVNKKESLIEDTSSLTDTQKTEIINKIDRLDKEIGDYIDTFTDKAKIFADNLKEVLLSDEPAVGSFSKEKMKEVVSGVIYAKDISLSIDKLMYMIMVTPQKNVDDAINSLVFANSLDHVLENLKDDHADLTVKRTGFAFIASDEEKAMMDGFGVMMGITVGAIIAIFLVGLRRVAFPLMSMLPLFVGIILMFGIYSITIGTLNMFTLMMPVLLMGLGIDYAIHLGSRYGEARGELGKDASVEDVLTRTFESIGTGLVVGASTTAFAFLSLVSCTMYGLVYSGIIAAIGVVTAFISVMYLLPILIIWREKKYLKKNKTVTFIRSSKFIALGRLSNSIVGTVIAILLIIGAIASILVVPNIEIETDAMKMEPAGLESVELAKELEDKFETSDMQTAFILNSYDELKAFRKEVYSKTDSGSKKYPTINSMMLMDARTAIRTFQKQGWEIGNLDTLNKYVDKFAQTQNRMGMSNENLAKMYEFIVKNYVNWETNEFLVMVPPAGYVWNNDFLQKHVKDIERLEENTETEGSGMVKVWAFIMDTVMKDLLTSSLVALGIVVLILILMTRSFRGTLICTLSMVASLMLTVFIIGLTGIKLNMINIIAFPFIIGLGIDYTVHIYLRIVKEENFNIVEALSSTGKAVLLTTLTTLAAFGSFSLSVHPGLAQMGLFASIGLISAFLSSVFIIPLLVKLLYYKEVKEIKQ